MDFSRLRWQLVLLLTMFFSSGAFAFPEMIRHGYSNCITCHASPTGGGVLTHYGRALSQELLSTWATGEESNFAYGVVKSPDWLLLGGDFRAVQTYANTPTYEQGKFIVMQADVEAAATFGKFQFDINLGRQEPSSLFRNDLPIPSRRFFLTYRPAEDFSVRIGRFFPAYGINTAEHVFVTRRRLGFDEGSETYNVELAWLNNDYEFFVTGVLGNGIFPQLYQGLIFRQGTNLGDRYKVGLSYFLGANDSSLRQVGGPYAILGFSSRWFLTAETDMIHLSSNSGSNRWGFVDYLRMNYEPLRGLVLFGTQEFYISDTSDPSTAYQAYGLGAQWFPRPHFEVQAIWQKKKTATAGSTFTDYAWLLMHFYL